MVLIAFIDFYGLVIIGHHLEFNNRFFDQNKVLFLLKTLKSGTSKDLKCWSEGGRLD